MARKAARLEAIKKEQLAQIKKNLADSSDEREEEEEDDYSDPESTDRKPAIIKAAGDAKKPVQADKKKPELAIDKIMKKMGK